MDKKSSVLYNNQILSWYPNYKYVNTWILELIFKYLANENKFRFPDWRTFIIIQINDYLFKCLNKHIDYYFYYFYIYFSIFS